MTAVCYERITRNARLLMHELSQDDKELCVHVLKGVEIKFSSLLPKHKAKSFEEVYREVMD